jgi:hypothetical protein
VIGRNLQGESSGTTAERPIGIKFQRNQLYLAIDLLLRVDDFQEG